MDDRSEKEVARDALWWTVQYLKALALAYALVLAVLGFLAWLDGGL